MDETINHPLPSSPRYHFFHFLFNPLCRFCRGNTMIHWSFPSRSACNRWSQSDTIVCWSSATGLSDSFHLHFDTLSRCYPSYTGPLSVPVRRFVDGYHFPASFLLVPPSVSGYTLSYKSELQNFSLITSSCHFIPINCIALFCYITQGLQAVTGKFFCLKNEKMLLKVRKKQYDMIESHFWQLER